MKDTVAARARVRVLVEIEEPGRFNINASLQHVFTAAKLHAISTIEAGIGPGRIVGEPEVTVTFTEDDQ